MDIGGPPELGNDHDRAICADVMAAARSGTADWWFWFSWAERIAPAGAPAAAAVVIVTELRRPADVHSECTPGGRRNPQGIVVASRR